uniref:Fe2OG dioxygenase domain-containing protein n=1 Tax=Chromera velia CCMP2878 TaxID=1169474 RepID=A0A0G4FCN6_9ALVE|eukprot:Cvel_16179.t1-p1 / transcript=Cvel_16179.t1 / gene=Cvel_16179 / organism=Chromera_velia_CCMP2878 / gene_product=hypothetical protein / transcript_product=hypothetical protein / location=Cvel_scaffold1234:19135-20732(-) / protein_length=263 / sequence_SO=supercontig / SO=protein_coding / is_pseudo=false
MTTTPAVAGHSTNLESGGKRFWEVTREPGQQKAELPIWTASADAVSVSPPKSPPWREDIRDGIFVLHGVLSKEECEGIIDVSSEMGYTEDAPVSLGRNVRHNDNCVWIVDPFLNDEIFKRCKDLLPGELSVGSGMRLSLFGLNRRWRLYRYSKDDIFRWHTDGGWTGSGLRGGAPVSDVFDGRCFSWLTFLIYLNDGFNGGGTRFRIANSEFSVTPRQGSVLCFFHGYHPLSPLHEGEMVEEGRKFVARTDVLYEHPPGTMIM